MPRARKPAPKRQNQKRAMTREEPAAESETLARGATQDDPIQVDSDSSEAKKTRSTHPSQPSQNISAAPVPETLTARGRRAAARAQTPAVVIDFESTSQHDDEGRERASASKQETARSGRITRKVASKRAIKPEDTGEPSVARTEISMANVLSPYSKKSRDVWTNHSDLYDASDNESESGDGTKPLDKTQTGIPATTPSNTASNLLASGEFSASITNPEDDEIPAKPQTKAKAKPQSQTIEEGKTLQSKGSDLAAAKAGEPGATEAKADKPLKPILKKKSKYGGTDIAKEGPPLSQEGIVKIPGLVKLFVGPRLKDLKLPEQPMKGRQQNAQHQARRGKRAAAAENTVPSTSLPFAQTDRKASAKPPKAQKQKPGVSEAASNRNAGPKQGQSALESRAWVRKRTKILYDEFDPEDMEGLTEEQWSDLERRGFFLPRRERPPPTPPPPEKPVVPIQWEEVRFQSPQQSDLSGGKSKRIFVCSGRVFSDQIPLKTKFERAYTSYGAAITWCEEQIARVQGDGVESELEYNPGISLTTIGASIEADGTHVRYLVETKSLNCCKGTKRYNTPPCSPPPSPAPSDYDSPAEVEFVDPLTGERYVKKFKTEEKPIPPVTLTGFEIPGAEIRVVDAEPELFLTEGQAIYVLGEHEVEKNSGKEQSYHTVGCYTERTMAVDELLRHRNSMKDDGRFSLSSGFLNPVVYEGPVSQP